MMTLRRQQMAARLRALCGPAFARLDRAMILLLGLVSYANSLAVPMQFDDDAAVRISTDFTIDPYSFDGFIRKARWFTDLTFDLNRRLHGEQVLGFHLCNLAIHLAAALVIYLLVQRAITALRETFRIAADDGGTAFSCRFIPFATAALFVCHPIQTQAVTYIAQRYTSLATLLYVSSLLAYLTARRAVGEARPLQARLWGGVCLLLALAAMKSKENAFTLPLMMAAFEAALFRGELLKKRLFMLLGAALLLVIPLQLLYTHGTENPANLLGRMATATAETHAITRGDYLLTQFRVVATYLRLLLLPLGQNLDYDYPVSHTLFEPSVCAALLLHLALAGLAVALFSRSRRCLASAAPETGIALRLAALGIGWFYLALSVESSVMPIRDVLVEHRLYLPSIGFFMTLAAGGAALVSRRPRYRRVAWCVTALLCGALAAATIARNRIWGDPLTLWRDVVTKSPHKARPRHTVGFLSIKRMRLEEALPQLVRAVELEPDNEKYRITLNAALSLFTRYRGRCSAGIEYQKTADMVDPAFAKPWSAVSYNNLGLAYEHLGNPYLAQENYRKALVLNPALDYAWYNLALVAARRLDTATAAEALKMLAPLNAPLEQAARRVIREKQGGYPLL
jgi:tetratricopeptide (TPR) repeat protein